MLGHPNSYCRHFIHLALLFSMPLCPIMPMLLDLDLDPVDLELDMQGMLGQPYLERAMTIKLERTPR